MDSWLPRRPLAVCEWEEWGQSGKEERDRERGRAGKQEKKKRRKKAWLILSTLIVLILLLTNVAK